MRWAALGPSAITFFAIVVTIFIFTRSVLAYTQGLFVYPLDDTYIHLAMAKTLAHTGVWGIGPSNFASASSSPGWTLILAAFDGLFGVHLLTPLLINLALAAVLCFVLDRALLKLVPGAGSRVRCLISLTLVFVSPIPSLVFIGMEHVGQTLAVFLVILTTSVALKASRPFDSWLVMVPLLLSACAAGALRYESVFVVIPAGLLLFIRRRRREAFAVFGASALVPLTFGFYAHHMSGYWLPFSVLAKAQAGGLREAISHPLTVILGKFSHLPLILPMVAAWVARRAWRDFWNPLNCFLLLAGVLTIEHLYAASIGWLMRYETYFVFSAVFSLLACVADYHAFIRQEGSTLKKVVNGCELLIVAGLIGHLFQSLLPRLRDGLVLPVAAACDRFDEHIQMARFVSSHYDHATVVLDDIGAVAYYTDAKLIDLVGLGSVEPLRILRTGRYLDSADVQAWASRAGASIAITQPSPQIVSVTPPNWILLQIWKQPRNVVFGDRLTAVYATSPMQVEQLCSSLEAFRLTPHDVRTLDKCR